MEDKLIRAQEEVSALKASNQKENSEAENAKSISREARASGASDGHTVVRKKVLSPVKAPKAKDKVRRVGTSLVPLADAIRRQALSQNPKQR
jgi:hypothetical protein